MGPFKTTRSRLAHAAAPGTATAELQPDVTSETPTAA
jgi:hypothetical protein